MHGVPALRQLNGPRRVTRARRMATVPAPVAGAGAVGVFAGIALAAVCSHYWFLLGVCAVSRREPRSALLRELDQREAQQRAPGEPDGYCDDEAGEGFNQDVLDNLALLLVFIDLLRYYGGLQPEDEDS